MQLALGYAIVLPRSVVLRRFLVSMVLGVLAGVLTYQVRIRSQGPAGAGDFDWAIVTATDLLAGRDPYNFTPTNLLVPYPLPVALFGIPLAWAPPPVAAGIFFGLSTALLVWSCFRSGHPERLAVLLSFPYFAALFFTQWSPLIMAAFMVPVLGPLLVLIKPQIALPVFVAKPSRFGVGVAVAVLVLSLLVYPTWPWRWAAMIQEYERVIPAAVLPFGPLLLLTLLAWKDERARLLFMMAVLPVRAVYDLCPLWLAPASLRSSLLIALVSWVGLFVPSGTGDLFSWWAVPLLYLPAVSCVLWSNLGSISSMLRSIIRRTTRLPV